MKWLDSVLEYLRRVGRHHYAELRGLNSPPAEEVSDQEPRPDRKTSDVPSVRSLSPTYDAGERGEYVQILKSELTKTGLPEVLTPAGGRVCQPSALDHH